MSGEMKPDYIMQQVIGVFDNLSKNSNSNLNADNLDKAFENLVNAVIEGYKRIEAEFQGQNIDVKPASTPEAVEAKQEAPVKTATVTPAVIAEKIAQPTPAKSKVAASESISSETLPSEAPPAEALTKDEKLAEEFIAEKGSIAKAVAFLNAPENVRRGRKFGWEKIVLSKGEGEPTVEAEDEDQKEAQAFIEKHGSAMAAVEFLNAPENKRRGRKSRWEKIVFDAGHKELMEAPTRAADPMLDAVTTKGSDNSSPVSGYKFAAISRTPFNGMDPEDAIKYDKITCLIDGMKRVMLSRHLRQKYGMSREEYIAHFGLRADYPITAEIYSGEKRRLAKEQGLGKKDTVNTLENTADAVSEQAPTKRRKRKVGQRG